MTRLLADDLGMPLQTTTILFTFALGNSTGDLFDEQLGVGYRPTVALVARRPPTGARRR